MKIGAYYIQLKDAHKMCIRDSGKHYTKSNLNVCYAAPRSSRKARDWYETQLTVSKVITRMNGYPETVSYTHLDVYKRQAEGGIDNWGEVVTR